MANGRHQEALIFELTQRCNHDCLHCYNVWKGRAPYPSGELSPSDTLALMTKVLDETQAKGVSLSGGEPLLRPDIFELAGALRSRGTTVNLITNGSLLNGEKIKRFEDSISLFELPLLSSDRTIHDRLSGTEGAFDKATMAMADLKSAEQLAIGVFVATRLNLPTWTRTIELAVALGLDGLLFNRFNPGGKGLKNLERLQADPREIQDALDVGEDLSAAYEIPISCSVVMPPCVLDIHRYKRLTFGFCAAGTERGYPTLDPQGNLRPCNHSPTLLGSAREMGFWELMEGPLMREFVAARPASCSGCGQEMTCLGGCKASAEACTGSYWEIDPFVKAYRREKRG